MQGIVSLISPRRRIWAVVVRGQEDRVRPPHHPLQLRRQGAFAAEHLQRRPLSNAGGCVLVEDNVADLQVVMPTPWHQYQPQWDSDVLHHVQRMTL